MYHRPVKVIIFVFLCSISSFLSSCRKRSYPCPGNGQTSASTFSRFDEDGNLKSEKKKKKIKKNDRGLVDKKQVKRLKSHKKKSLNDKPKNFKK